MYENNRIVRRGTGNILRSMSGRFVLPEFVGDEKEKDTVIARVKSMLLVFGDELALERATDKDLMVIKDVESPVGRHLSFRHMVDDIPVYGSHIRVQVDGDKVVQLRMSRYLDRSNNDVLVGDDEPDELTEADVLLKIKTNHKDEKQVGEHGFEKVYFPMDNGLRLAYQVDLWTDAADWRYVIDARTGDVLLKEDLRCKAAGTGNIYLPNPVVAANDNSLEEGVTSENNLNALLSTETLSDIDLTDGKHKLTGPWVSIENKVTPDNDPPEQASSYFDYKRQDTDFEATNVYYHIDTFHRYMVDELGINNVMDWSIPADIHVYQEYAYYSSAGYLGFGNSGTNRPDRGEDGDCMIHEYNHAMQHDMVSNWGQFNSTTSRNETKAMGEGTGDFLACCFFHECGSIFQPEVFEDWIFGANPPDGASHTGPGLRRVDGTKTYPGEDTIGNTGDWVSSWHKNGEIWSACLWDAYLAGGGESSSATNRVQARKKFLRSLILHHFKMVGDESMPEAAELLLETNAEDKEILGKQLMPLVDALHDRNILASDDGVDLWIKDKADHTGTENISGAFWNSPDLWIRNQEDDVEAHEAPEYGQDNWFYARVRNRGTGTARAFVVTFEVKIWQGTQFKYRSDFIPFVSAAVGFDLGPGESQVVKACWPKELVPGAGSHGCLLVSAYCPTDEAVLDKHVWEDNNLAQKNLTIVDLKPDQSTDVSFRVGHLLNPAQTFRIEAHRPYRSEKLEFSIWHNNKQLAQQIYHSVERLGSIGVGTGVIPGGGRPIGVQPTLTMLEPVRMSLNVRNLGGDVPDDAADMEMRLAAGSEIYARVAGDGTPVTGGDADAIMSDEEFLSTQAELVEGDDANSSSIRLQPLPVAGFPVTLRRRLSPTLKLKIKAPADAKPGDRHRIDVVQRDVRRQIVGGITIEVNII